MKANEIVENNIQMIDGIYSNLYKKYYKMLDVINYNYEDTKQEVYLYLLKYCNNYNDKYALSTYIHLCINNAIKDLIRNNNKIKRKSELNKVYDNSEDGNISFFDEYMNEDLNIAYFELMDIVNKELTSKEKEVILFLIKGYQLKEIAKHYNVSTQYISQIRKRITYKLQQAI